MEAIHQKFPFCCKKDSIFFSTLLENYIALRDKYSGIDILNNDYNLYKNLSNCNLEVLYKKVITITSTLENVIVKQLEKKLWDIASLLFIYYIKLMFQKISEDFNHEQFIKFIKDESIESQIITMTNITNQAWIIIKKLFEDIETYNQTDLN
ncbi:hypothetical protein SGLAD_v1c02140 [Spiroplasma gladiatoris]|uniref:Uncharacterized protein n=1 Tax=Spiroplasma gladiatoris TaxID=2143 RepID=A0A4P7AI93_9MOLU|nr:hypothetical protein [Spiroplasma gladiatoris]QBQ07413.1 hypothetical protein SGLAD_v1c02140 [Spiroplasma gladiatoris]